MSEIITASCVDIPVNEEFISKLLEFYRGEESSFTYLTNSRCDSIYIVVNFILEGKND
jgi:hypothetical protein